MERGLKMWFYRITSYEWKYPFVSADIIIGEWLPVKHNEFVYPPNRVHRIEFKDDEMPYTEPDINVESKHERVIAIEALVP